MQYELEAGGGSGIVPDNIPGSRDDAWFATLVGTSGQKGYFHGSEVIGQLDAAPAGTTPTRAIGHIHGGGHTAVFEVLK